MADRALTIVCLVSLAVRQGRGVDTGGINLGGGGSYGGGLDWIWNLKI